MFSSSIAVYIFVSSNSDQIVPATLASGSLDQLKDFKGLEGCGTFFFGTSGRLDAQIGAGGGACGGGGGLPPGVGGGSGGAWDIGGGGGGGTGPLENSDDRPKSRQAESLSTVLRPTACQINMENETG
jgi:hypothetical protein